MESDHIVPNMHSYNKGVFQICRIQGDFWFKFSRGQDFEEGKALFGIGMYQFYLTLMVNFQKIHLQRPAGYYSFSENNMVNIVK